MDARVKTVEQERRNHADRSSKLDDCNSTSSLHHIPCNPCMWRGKARWLPAADGVDGWNGKTRDADHHLLLYHYLQNPFSLRRGLLSSENRSGGRKRMTPFSLSYVEKNMTAALHGLRNLRCCASRDGKFKSWFSLITYSERRRKGIIRSKKATFRKEGWKLQVNLSGQRIILLFIPIN